MALRALNASWALPVYPVFEDEKASAPDKEIGQAKTRVKKTDRTNIIATKLRLRAIKNFSRSKKDPTAIVLTFAYR